MISFFAGGYKQDDITALTEILYIGLAKYMNTAENPSYKAYKDVNCLIEHLEEMQLYLQK